MDILKAIYDWIMLHQTWCALIAYHLASAFVGSLEMPDATSGKLYGFFFRFVNRFAANYSRALASTQITASQGQPVVTEAPPLPPPTPPVTTYDATTKKKV